MKKLRVHTFSKCKHILAILFAVAIVLTVLPIQNVSAETLPVIDKSERLTLNYTYKELDTVNSKKFKLKFKEKFSVSKATFSSSNKKVAKVSKKGVVTAKKEGTAIITVHYKNNTYQCGVVVFDGKGAMYELRKNAKNVRDNCSLLALDFREVLHTSSGVLTTGSAEKDLEIVMNPELLEKELLTNPKAFDKDFTRLYQCYEVRKSNKEIYKDNPWCGIGATHAFIDFEQTAENLIATGLFEKGKVDKVFDKIDAKPIKPFTYKGKTFEYIAKYEKNGKTYYISSRTGMIYDEFIPDNINSRVYYPECFKLNYGKLFGAVDYSKYEENGELRYSFFPTTVKYHTTIGEKINYMSEAGYSHEVDYNFGVFNGVVNLNNWFDTMSNSEFTRFVEDKPKKK